MTERTRGELDAVARGLLEFAPDAVIGVDRDGRIAFANERTSELFGYGPDELPGLEVERLMPNRFREAHLAHRARYLEDPRARAMGPGLELRGRMKDGREFPCQVSLAPAPGESGAVALAAIQDVSDRRRAEDELRTAVKRLEAAGDVALAVGGETELSRILKVLVERGRALVDARALVILLQQREELVVAAISGHVDDDVVRLRLPAGGVVEDLIEGRLVATRIEERHDQASALLAPLVFRGEPLGAVVALDRLGLGPSFDEEDARLLEAFAASAATAVATARSMAEDRLQNAIQAAEHERGRWARELHDETLQGLAALRVRLSSALRRHSPQALEAAGQEAVAQIGEEIGKLRNLITELRPAALDDIGLEAALRALVERSTAKANVAVDLRISLKGGPRLSSPVLETTVYRLVQEALANVVEHARAARVEVGVVERDAGLEITIADDGVGFEPRIRPEGFGLRGMRERVTLAGGRFDLRSVPGEGTSIVATLPLPDPSAGDVGERRRSAGHGRDLVRRPRSAQTSNRPRSSA